MPSFIFQFQLVSSLDEIFKPETPAKLFRPKATKVIATKSDFLNDFFFKSSKFSAILLLVRFRLDWSRDVNSITLIPLKPSDLVVSFSIVEKYTVEYA